MTTKATETIYVALVGENVDVWRPVEATPEGGEKYRLPPNQPPDEAWAFPPGSLVRCEPRSFAGDTVLAAVETAG